MEHHRIQKSRRQLRMSTRGLGPALQLRRRTILLGKPARCHAEIVVIGRQHLLEKVWLIGLMAEAPDSLPLPYAIPYAIGMAAQVQNALTLLLREDRLLRYRLDQANADESGRDAHRGHDIGAERAERELVHLQVWTTQPHHFAIRE